MVHNGDVISEEKLIKRIGQSCSVEDQLGFLLLTVWFGIDLLVVANRLVLSLLQFAFCCNSG